MRQFKEAVAAAADLETTKSVFVSAFEAAVADGNLVSFRAACTELRASPPTATTLPYAFAYEARSYLHDPEMWVWPDGGIAYEPKPELMAALAACLARPEPINCRDNYYWLIVSGLTEFVAGNIDAGFRQLALASTYSDFYRVVRCDLGGGAAFAKTYPTPAQLQMWRTAPKFPAEAEFIADFVAPPSMVISISFDIIYCRAFAASWLAKVAAAGVPEIGLHFHVMFRGARDTAVLSGLLDEARRLGVKLAISVDDHVTACRAYFASARFLKGAGFLRRFACPLILVDADATLPDPQAFRTAHLPKIMAETRILGLLTDGPWNGYLPWRRFSATWILCPHTPDALAFLERTADCIGYFWDARGNNWWIDQMGLEIARRSLIAERTNPPVFDQIYSALPDLFETSEAYKIERIGQLPEMAQRLDAGVSYWQALFEISNG